MIFRIHVLMARASRARLPCNGYVNVGRMDGWMDRAAAAGLDLRACSVFICVRACVRVCIKESLSRRTHARAHTQAIWVFGAEAFDVEC